MILLRANSELKQTFEKLIETMKIPVRWSGIFVVIDNYMILQGEVRSLFFHFDTRKVATNIIDIPLEDKAVKEISDNVRVQNAINMILYAFGKWGTIKGLKVEKDRAQLNRLFAGIMKEYGVEPEYTEEYMRFYRGGIRVTYEDVIQMAIEYQDETGAETEERSRGLWRKIIWKRERDDFLHVETTLEERRAGRLGRNFYMVGYLCPKCEKKLYMAVYPHGREFRIETDEGGVLLARAAACDSCHAFYTPRPKKMFMEGDIYAMYFGDDAEAYEDYLELLGRDGDKVSNYHCNQYADKRAYSADEDMDSEEELKELCMKLPELSERELKKLEARIEEGFYPDESARRYEGRIKEQWEEREKLGQGASDRQGRRAEKKGEGTDDTEREVLGVPISDGQKTGREQSKKERIGILREDAGKRQGDREKVSGASSENAKEREQKTEAGAADRALKKDASDVVNNPKEHEEAKGKYEARMAVLERYSDRQLKELKGQLQKEHRLMPDEKSYYLKQIDKTLSRERVKKLEEKVDACAGKNYVLIKRVLEEVERAEIPEDVKEGFLNRLGQWKREQAEREVKQLIDKMPSGMDRAQYKHFIQRVGDYEDVDLTPYETALRDRRMEAEKQEIANVVKRARKLSREDLAELREKLEEGDFLPELIAPYLEKIEDRIKEMDAAEIELICPNPMQMTYEEGIRAYEKIEAGDFLPELKTDALKMLTKRLAKLKTDECELLVQKLKSELADAGIAENERLHFYPARKVLLHQAEPEETEVIDFAMASYASEKGMFEYPILVADATRNGSGREGMILTPDHLYISTMLNAYGVPIASITGITASTGLLNKGLYAHRKDGEKAKIPYVVDGKELVVFADVLDNFVHYLQEKPDSRNLTYLAKEKHETICCFRCGYSYKGNGVCPRCGYQNND